MGFFSKKDWVDEEMKRWRNMTESEKDEERKKDAEKAYMEGKSFWDHHDGLLSSIAFEFPEIKDEILNGEYFKTLEYLCSEEALETLCAYYQPYHKYDYDVIAKDVVSNYRSELFQKFFEKYNIFDSNFHSQAFQQASSFEPFKAIPDEVIANGIDDSKFPNDEIGNPLLNYLNEIVNIVTDEYCIEWNFFVSVWNKYQTDREIKASIILGLDKDRTLYDPEFYKISSNDTKLDILIKISQQ